MVWHNEVDTLKNVDNGASEVYKLASVLQCFVFIWSKNIVPPNFSDKSTTVKPPKLLNQVGDKLRVQHYSIRTEQAYASWIKRYIFFQGKRHPTEMGTAEVETFLTHLAVEGNVAASTQNQAKAVVLFLYRQVLNQELPWLENVEQAKVSRRLPVVLTVNETRALLDRLKGVYRVQANLLYGTGMRLMEVMRLRVKDIDFERKEILIPDGKGAKGRVTMLPVMNS